MPPPFPPASSPPPHTFTTVIAPASSPSNTTMRSFPSTRWKPVRRSSVPCSGTSLMVERL